MDEMLDLKQAARYLKVSYTTLRKMVSDGRLVAVPSKIDTRKKLVSIKQLDALKPQPEDLKATLNLN